MNKIGILIPTYNRSKFIKECIINLLNQVYHNYLIIVYDDGSTDNTDHIIKEIKSEKLYYVKSDVNNGVVYARNKLLDLAIENSINIACWQDSDDFCSPDRLSIQYKYLNDNTIPIVYSRWSVYPSLDPMPLNDLCNASAMFKILEAPRFKEINRHPTPTTIGGEDIVWRNDFCDKYGEPVIIDQCLYYVRRHPDRIGRWRKDPNANKDWYNRMISRIKN